MVNDILWAIENQNITAVMALDLSAAFDTVNHKILSSVLEHNFGLDDTVLNECCAMCQTHGQIWTNNFSTFANLYSIFSHKHVILFNIRTRSVFMQFISLY